MDLISDLDKRNNTMKIVDQQLDVSKCKGFCGPHSAGLGDIIYKVKGMLYNEHKKSISPIEAIFITQEGAAAFINYNSYLAGLIRGEFTYSFTQSPLTESNKG